MPAFNEGSTVKITYETNFGNENKVAGEVLNSYNRGNGNMDFTCVVIQHPREDRVIFASRGFKTVYSLHDWDGSTFTPKSEGRDIGEFISLRKIRTVDGDLPEYMREDSPETPDYSDVWEYALENEKVPYDDSMPLYDGDIAIYDDRKGCDVWCIILPLKIDMGLMMCSIIGVGGERDNSNYTKYYSEEDGYIHYDEIDQHYEEGTAIEPCMIKAVVRQTEENRGSKVYTDGEFLI